MTINYRYHVLVAITTASRDSCRCLWSLLCGRFSLASDSRFLCRLCRWWTALSLRPRGWFWTWIKKQYAIIIINGINDQPLRVRQATTFLILLLLMPFLSWCANGRLKNCEMDFCSELSLFNNGRRRESTLAWSQFILSRANLHERGFAK